MTSIEAVRLKTSDKSTITRETARGNGTDKHFKMKHAPLIALPAVEVRQNGSLLTVTTDYTVDITHGIITFVVTPVSDRGDGQPDELEFIYYWSIFSDDEVQYFLDEAGADVTIASARLLLAWAADAAKIAKRQTLSGGGGLGQVVVDTSVAAKELRATAAALIDQAQSLGESIPADGLTEIPWTEAMFRRAQDQHVIRES